MNDECINISDLIVAYTNKNISKENNNILIKHLAICPESREELALILSLSQIVLEQSKDIPEDIMKNAFNLITREEIPKSKTSLDELKTSLLTLKDVLLTTKKSIRLAIQFI